MLNTVVDRLFQGVSTPFDRFICILINLYHSHVVQMFSTLGIIAVIFLQSDGEHGFKTRPSTWVQVVLVGVLDQIIAVLVLVAVLETLLIWVLAVVVHHWMMVTTAGLLGRPVVPMAAQYHHHGYSDQQQEGTASRQHIVPVGRDRLHRHCVYCGLHPRHGTPWRAGGHITGWNYGRGRQACRPHWSVKGC